MTAVEPTGVGDAFAVAALAWGLGHERAAQVGCVLAAYVVETTSPRANTAPGLVGRERDGDQPGRSGSRPGWFGGTRAEPERLGRPGRPERPASPARARDNAPAQRQPVARVAVDIPLAHLDRPFDYLVPERLSDAARPGCRVRVRFAGQLADGFVLARADASGHPGRLSYLDRVVSPEPVLTPEIGALARAVADRYAGTLADVLRLAIPPRHAGTEAKPSPPAAGRCRPPGPAPGRGTRPVRPS